MINAFLHNNAPFIAFLALLLTVANFVYLFLKDAENSRRWNSMNLARLVVKNLRLDTWREIPREVFPAIKWGYEDPFVVIPINDTGTKRANTVNAAASVIAVREDLSTIDGTNAITREELVNQLGHLKYDVSKAHFMKLYRIAFEVLKTGGTAASMFTIDTQFPDIQHVLLGKVPLSPQTLQPGESTWSVSNLKFELDEQFTDQMRCDVKLTFVDIHQKRHEILYSYLFERSTASFRRT